MSDDLHVELREAVEELVGHVEATAFYCRQASNPTIAGEASVTPGDPPTFDEIEAWVCDVHGVTPDVQTIEDAADRINDRLVHE